MAKFSSVWAIDIGQSALKALKLVPAEVPDHVVAEAFDFIEYDKILSQPDADPEELVRGALETFLGRNDLKGSRVAIGVPGQAGLVKFIKLPPVEKKRIPDIVKFEARQQIPFALEEVIWDYQEIGGEEEADDDEDSFTMAEVGLFAMKRDQIFRAIQPLKAAGIEVDVVQMSPLALYNFVAFDQLADAKPEPGEEPASVVLLDVGVDNTDLIITDGTRIWQRNVPIGGNHFTRALTKELKQTFAKAEHLKRNATKSQDPRAVFTAMRGVFNDFSSEVGRSIGFYSSVNRQAKITKIIGLGNGFKLPGLQKFLQQNLNYEVERLEAFEKLGGEEVVTAPQFVDNLMSYAAPYGLGLQGLGISKLQTNLLPPEIEQVRMIRRKKPWALAASVLLMLGFSGMFFGLWRANAKAVNPAMTEAVGRAKSVAQQGASQTSAFDAAKSEFSAKKTEGEALVAETSELASWPALLTALNAALPNPTRELQLDPSVPANQEILRDLRVHIDAVVPRYRADLALEWFDDPTYVPDWARNYMHPLDRATPPSGEGWVIQVYGHHYNPSPIGAAAKKLSEREKAIAKGPVNYLTQNVVPRLWVPKLRQMGIHHALLTYVSIDDKWVSAKASASASKAAPMLARQSAPTPAAGDMGGEMGMPGGSGMEGMMSGSYGPGSGSGMMESMMPGMMDPGMMSSMYAGYSGMGMYGAQAKDAPEETTLTRTDFLINFVWQPPGPEEEPKSIEDITKELVEAAKGKGAPKALSEADIAKASQEQLKASVDKQIKAITEAVGKASGKNAQDAETKSGEPAAPAAAPASK